MIPDDLQSISAKFTMPPEFSLIEPVATEGGIFGSVVEIDNTKPITLKWKSNGGKGYIDISITAAQSITNIVSVTCKVRDDGEFTVPEEFSSQLVFGSGSDDMMGQMLQMMNMITMQRHSEAPITGSGITSGKVSSEQAIMVNVVAAGSAGNQGGNSPEENDDDSGDSTSDDDSDENSDDENPNSDSEENPDTDEIPEE